MKEKNFIGRLKNMGPAAIITSAFIGPGTIITATIAGVKFNYQLLWSVVFATISLIVLLEMSARSSIITQKSLVDSSIAVFPNSSAWRYFINISVMLTVLAVCFGFEAGNITGAARGLSDILNIDLVPAVVIVGTIAFATAIIGNVRIIERIMLFFVSLMGLLFLITMIIVRPNVVEMLKGIFMPSIPEQSLINLMALIGTTLIGINLVLHSVTSKNKWQKAEDIADARFDIIVNVLIGGLITLSIATTSAVVLGGKGVEIKSPLQFSESLEPILGSFARSAGSFGLFAAGLSSAIAVPFTLKSITANILKFKGGVQSVQAKVFGGVAVAAGMFFALSGINPLQIIITAQATSGFTLPLFAALLLIVCNNKQLMGQHTNNVLQNVIGAIAFLVSLGLGSWGLYNVILRLFA